VKLPLDNEEVIVTSGLDRVLAGDSVAVFGANRVESLTLSGDSYAGRTPLLPRSAEHDRAMAHTLISDLAGEVAVQSGAVVSKVVHRGDGLNVTVFGFDAGEQLTEHQAHAPLSSRSSPDGSASSSTATSSNWLTDPGCT
jgi:hypothetical protein